MSSKCMLLAAIMSNRKNIIYASLAALFLLGWFFSDSNKNNNEITESVKVALREVGHQLLLTNQDTTSLVLPIIELNSFKYQLSFQNKLSFEPSVLVTNVKNVFAKLELPSRYRVEVIQCSNNEVSYSYQMSIEKENTIIPCSGRFLPNDCYTIELKFTNTLTTFFTNQLLFGGLLMLLVIFLVDAKFSKRKTVMQSKEKNTESTPLGSFLFYPEQNKLVKQALEISLSKKECELLAIFVGQPNQIITRNELTKKVWEDNGVFVGRSLDTYISKLRKKLKDDASIKLTNVHGVGYKLELN